MCGIAGTLSLDPDRHPIDEPFVKRMLQAIEHRGPDDSGVYLNDAQSVGLGSVRLAILDLSPKGHMPMSNADGSVWIVYNGEVYNFQESREMLKAKGYSFRSNSDTEVILALYEEYGVDCLRYLRGMFAFALWDRRKQRLFCARDRMGQKPFKYFFDGDRFVFSSELKAILQDPSIPRKLDPNAINHYLSYQYVPAPMTGFQNLHKLPPAHYLLIENGTLSVKRYWSLDYRHKLTLTEDEWQDRLTEALRESVSLRMISDVPLGAFLSGGVDSSTIVALMSELSDQPVKTFSIGFKEASFNELSYARQVAERYSTDHREFIVEPQSLEMFDELVYAYEEPYADSSALPSYYVAKMTREFVTVALNGDGGDENFLGYPWSKVHRFASFYQKIPALIRKGVIVPSAQLALKLIPHTFFDRAHRFATSAQDGSEAQYFQYLCYFNEAQKASLLTDEFQSLLSGPTSTELTLHAFRSAPATDPLDQAAHVDLELFLAGDLLPKVDIATMMNSLEGRSPFLDHPFLELTAQMPTSLKLRGGTSKYLLKKIAERFLPRDVIYRKKQGFQVPIRHWFKHELKDFVTDTLLHGELLRRGIIRKSYVEHLLKTHQQTQLDVSRHLWALLTLDRWLALFELND